MVGHTSPHSTTSKFLLGNLGTLAEEDAGPALESSREPVRGVKRRAFVPRLGGSPPPPRQPSPDHRGSSTARRASLAIDETAIFADSLSLHPYRNAH